MTRAQIIALAWQTQRPLVLVLCVAAAMLPLVVAVLS